MTPRAGTVRLPPGSNSLLRVSPFSQKPFLQLWPTPMPIPFGTAAIVAILLLSACSEKPLIISADTSCERFRHISANDEQIKVFSDNWAVMESYADQVIVHNQVYDAACLKDPPK